jgi:hypothetical protein
MQKFPFSSEDLPLLLNEFKYTRLSQSSEHNISHTAHIRPLILKVSETTGRAAGSRSIQNHLLACNQCPSPSARESEPLSVLSAQRLQMRFHSSLQRSPFLGPGPVCASLGRLSRLVPFMCRNRSVRRLLDCI